MGYLTWLDLAINSIQAFVITVVIAKTIKLTINTKTNALPFFFALAMGSYLLSTLYWIAYDILKPDTRMPMACNEISEAAVILLLSAGMGAILKDREKKAGEIAFAILFIGANITFWIIWSGEWLQDLILGIPYIYFFWLLIQGVKRRNCLSQKETRLTLTTGIIVFAMQILLLVMQGNVYAFIEGSCFALMLAMTVWLGVKSFRRKDFFLATVFFTWTDLSMYLSTDIYYILCSIVNTIAQLTMFSMLKKEVDADG